MLYEEGNTPDKHKKNQGVGERRKKKRLGVRMQMQTRGLRGAKKQRARINLVVMPKDPARRGRVQEAKQGELTSGSLTIR